MLATIWARRRRWRLSFADRPKEQCRGLRGPAASDESPGLPMNQFVPKGADTRVMPVAPVMPAYVLPAWRRSSP
jgi:hypothetical protein